MEVFELNNVYYIIKQDPYEVREIYMERVWFILNKIKNGFNDFNELIKLSRIYVNTTILKCDYLFEI